MADLNEKIEQLKKEVENAPDTTAEYDPEDIKANRVFAILAYFGILVLIPLFAAKESKYARFHTNQGIILCILDIIVTIILNILGSIPVVGWILRVVLNICLFVLFLTGLINVGYGRAKELPIVGKFQILK